MRIEEVRAIAFGPFEDHKLELAPGITVIHGPNESGKSTWHAALYAGLCGMRRGKGAARKQDREFQRCHRPWDGDSWEVAVVVRLDDGRCIELRHDLNGKVDSRATDLLTSADVSNTIMYDGAPDGSRFLGLNRDMFLSTICVKQSDILGILKDVDALQEQLQRAAATGGKDATAEQAISAIEEFHKTQVGLARKNSTRPLQSALDEVANAMKAHEEVVAAHSEYLELVGQRDRALHRARDAEAELSRLQAAARVGKLRTLERRLDRCRELAPDLPEREPMPPKRDRELEERVHDAVSSFRRRPDVPAPLEGPNSAELDREVAELPDAPEGDTEPAAEVLEAVQKWHDAIQALHFHEEEAPEEAAHEEETLDPSELRGLADELAVVVSEADAELQRRVDELRQPAPTRSSQTTMLIVIAAIVALAGVGLLVVGQPGVGAVLLIVGVGLGVLATRSPQPRSPVAELPQLEARLAVQQETRSQAEQRRRWAEARCQELGLPADPAELRRIARRIDDAAGAAERAQAWGTKRARLQHEADLARGHARQVLEDRGVDVGDEGVPFADSVETYKAQCRERARQVVAAERGDALREQLRLRRDAEAIRAETLQEREDAERAIDSLCQQLGIEAGDPDDAAEALEKWLEHREEERTQHQELRVAWTEYSQLLDGRTLPELEAEVNELRASVPNDDEHADGLAPSPEELEAAHDSEQELGAEANSLVGQVRERERTVPDVAEAEERLALARAELERVQRLAHTLKRTEEFLKDARDRINRDIAPVLGGSVTSRLGGVTDGRYTEALVDPSSLAVTVRSSTGRLRDAQLLSHGTAEQVYLLLRLAMAEHLVTEPETAPLILDDVLVQTDPQRSARILDLLHELSGNRQVILFSQEQDVLSWARHNLDGDDDRLIELHPAMVEP
jgi:exonuclease SbcC